jgi:hypothetical protein
MLFPNTYGAPMIQFTGAPDAKPSKILRIGVVLSGTFFQTRVYPTNYSHPFLSNPLMWLYGMNE